MSTKWILVAVFAGLLGWTACGDDDEGGGSKADCQALALCNSTCTGEADEAATLACQQGCATEHPGALEASTELFACQVASECTDAACFFEACESEFRACGYDAVLGPVSP